MNNKEMNELFSLEVKKSINEIRSEEIRSELEKIPNTSIKIDKVSKLIEKLSTYRNNSKSLDEIKQLNRWIEFLLEYFIFANEQYIDSIYDTLTSKEPIDEKEKLNSEEYCLYNTIMELIFDLQRNKDFLTKNNIGVVYSIDDKITTIDNLIMRFMYIDREETDEDKFTKALENRKILVSKMYRLLNEVCPRFENYKIGLKEQRVKYYISKLEVNTCEKNTFYILYEEVKLILDMNQIISDFINY